MASSTSIWTSPSLFKFAFPLPTNTSCLLQLECVYDGMPNIVGELPEFRTRLASCQGVVLLHCWSNEIAWKRIDSARVFDFWGDRFWISGLWRCRHGPTTCRIVLTFNQSSFSSRIYCRPFLVPALRQTEEQLLASIAAAAEKVQKSAHSRRIQNVGIGNGQSDGRRTKYGRPRIATLRHRQGGDIRFEYVLCRRLNDLIVNVQFWRIEYLT